MVKVQSQRSKNELDSYRTTVDGQTDSVKKYRIRLSVVIRPLPGSLDMVRLTARQISQKVQNSSVRRFPRSQSTGSERCSTARQSIWREEIGKVLGE